MYVYVWNGIVWYGMDMVRVSQKTKKKRNEHGCCYASPSPEAGALFYRTIEFPTSTQKSPSPPQPPTALPQREPLIGLLPRPLSLSLSLALPIIVPPRPVPPRTTLLVLQLLPPAPIADPPRFPAADVEDCDYEDEEEKGDEGGPEGGGHGFGVRMRVG